MGGHRARGRTSREDVSRSTRVGGDANGATTRRRRSRRFPREGERGERGENRLRFLPKGGRRFTVERVDDREPRDGFGGDPRRARGFEPRPRERPPPAVDFRVRRRRSVSVRRLRGARKRRVTRPRDDVRRFGNARRTFRVRSYRFETAGADTTRGARGDVRRGDGDGARSRRRVSPRGAARDVRARRPGGGRRDAVGTRGGRGMARRDGSGDRTYDGNDREGDGRAARAPRDRRATGSRGV